MTNKLAIFVEPVVLVLSSCVLQQRICASSRQWTKVASWPVIARSSFGEKPKKNVFVWLSTWTNSTIPLQMTRLDGSRALLLKKKERAGWRKKIPTISLFTWDSRQWWCSSRTRRSRRRRWSAGDHARPPRGQTFDGNGDGFEEMTMRTKTMIVCERQRWRLWSNATLAAGPGRSPWEWRSTSTLRLKCKREN